ncbi:hypothetical protein SAMN04488128_10453 [Chitinophaga eiseniae]|uniref:Uncharacterized protein n=1 Tax=Chitinophaga eiseniae TaxID=634771 RepID=A0A1T4T6J9_9BACT|nr:hypothetical protein SAMN04488128_10453 [Chitinophaga eiseniae]
MGRLFLLSEVTLQLVLYQRDNAFLPFPQGQTFV